MISKYFRYMQRSLEKEQQPGMTGGPAGGRARGTTSSPATTGITPMLERSFTDVVSGGGGASVAQRRFSTKPHPAGALSPLDCGSSTRDRVGGPEHPAGRQSGTKASRPVAATEKKRRPLSPSSSQAGGHIIKRSKSVTEEAGVKGSSSDKAFEEPPWE